MGALLTVLSPIFFGLLNFIIPDWQNTLCGILTDFAPIDVCACDLGASTVEPFAVDLSLDCAQGESELVQCIGFDFSTLLPPNLANLIENAGFPIPAIEYCIDCDFDLDGTATLFGLSGSIDGMFSCSYSLTGLPSGWPDLLLVDSLRASIAGSVDLTDGVEVTDCGTVVASNNGATVAGCTCSQEGCGENQIQLTCELQLPLIGDLFDINDVVDINNLLPLLGSCIDVPDPFDAIRREL